MAHKYINAGHTSVSCQTYEHAEHGQFVLVRFTNYRDQDGHMSMGIDLSPDKARELAATLIAMADAMQEVAA
jgi:hypothetical protein